MGKERGKGLFPSCRALVEQRELLLEALKALLREMRKNSGSGAEKELSWQDISACMDYTE